MSYLRGGEGAPLLLLHGLPGSAHTWKEAGRRLATRYDVLIPDLEGFGDSDVFSRDLHLDHDFYMEAHAEAVHRLLEELGVRPFYLGGHDFGGAVAMTLLDLFDERDVRGLVLSSARLFSAPPGSLPLRLTRAPVLGPLVNWFLAGTRSGLRLMYRVGAHNTSTFRPEDFDRHLTPSGIRQTRRIFRRSLVDSEGNFEKIEALLPELEIPSLVLWGDRDPFFPVAEAKRLVDTLPHATIAIFEETGHFVPEERPELTAWYVDDFLRAPRKRTGKTETRRSRC